MIDEKQIKAIELMLTGEHTKTQIAELVGVHRTTLYNWLATDEFMENLDKRLQEIKTIASKELNAKLPLALDKYWELAMTTTDARTKEKCLSYWINRSLGTPTSKLDITAEAKQSSMSNDDILNAIDSIDVIEQDMELIEDTE